MILSKNDYLVHLEADRIALGARIKWDLKANFIDEIWAFERLLRKTEYYQNCKKSQLEKKYFLLLKYILHKKSISLGFSIPINVFGPGLAIAHIGTVVVSNKARIGANCRIHACTNIGVSADSEDAPKIGNNVYIGPGAKLFGNINIADNIAIGANSVVNKSFLEPGITIAGIPAKKISNKGSKGLGPLRFIANGDYWPLYKGDGQSK